MSFEEILHESLEPRASLLEHSRGVHHSSLFYYGLGDELNAQHYGF